MTLEERQQFCDAFNLLYSLCVKLGISTEALHDFALQVLTHNPLEV